MKTTRYLVHRNGSNGANQPMRFSMPLLIIEAENAAEAVRIAYDEHGIEVYNNQNLWAEPVSKARKRDLAEVGEYCPSCHRPYGDAY